MNYPTIKIEGSILTGDILDRIEQGELKGQKSPDFAFMDQKVPVKDEIVRAWADAQDLYRIFQRRIWRFSEDQLGTTETRNQWMVPLLSLFGYNIEFRKAGEVVNGKNYAISHRDTERDNFPIHIMGFRDSLDRKRQDSGPRMSPHALVQEYLNLTEHLYAIVTNGYILRLLRDSYRLVKLSYIEFDLDQMFSEGHFADFAIMYRLIHASRMPKEQNAASESFIEEYHQESLDSGSRIRDGLSKAVEQSIITFANGFLKHPGNEELRQHLRDETINAKKIYQNLLRLIYRLLFLMVIEERNLIYSDGVDRSLRNIYYDYYSIGRLRNVAGKRHLADKRYKDYWISMKNTFRLFEREQYGQALGIKPLAGDLFGIDGIGLLKNCNLDNKTVIECLTNLSLFQNPVTNQKIRVNYAALNTEELGSVYEGLLEYDPLITNDGSSYSFTFVKGTERAASGTHYTPDELVTPLIKHSLDYIILDKIKEAEEEHKKDKSKDEISLKEQKLLSITVCDVACGSGHILLNAARRIATELACSRTGEDQPSPTAFRTAVRDVIRHCIYGVDINPLAVELCKVSLWLEAHNPNEPLNFLDHHIKCGNAIVGLAHSEELEQGIADEAFKTLPEDDKEVAAHFRKVNKEQRQNRKQLTFNFEEKVGRNIEKSLKKLNEIVGMPEQTPEQIEKKQDAYQKFQRSKELWDLKLIADILVAQFFIPKTPESKHKITTDEEYWRFMRGERALQGQAVAKAMAVAQEKKFFHYFLEFPKVIAGGGFDCILGNPPFLGGQYISSSFGDKYMNFLRFNYENAGSMDLVGFFFRRIYSMLKDNSFLSLITTNTISQGKLRKGALDQIIKNNGNIIFAIKSMTWPGDAVVFISLVTIHKGDWKLNNFLDGKKVSKISSFLDGNESKINQNPIILQVNKSKSFQGHIPLGEGFIISKDEANRLIEKNQKNKEVIFPYLTGLDLNKCPYQEASRCIIYFNEIDEEHASHYIEPFLILEERVKRVRLKKDSAKYPRMVNEWWKFWNNRQEMMDVISKMDRVLVHTKVSKTHAFSFINPRQIFSDLVIVFAEDSYSRFAILQSSVHEYWAWKYGSTLKSDRRYTPSSCYETFPFSKNNEAELENIGKSYHDHRLTLMDRTKLGMTKIYNHLNNPIFSQLDDDELHKISLIDDGEFKSKYGKNALELKKHLLITPNTCSFNEAINYLNELRKLYDQLDYAVIKSYGWHEDSDEGFPIDVSHNYYQIEFLPENDCVRYTIPPESRREILNRLLVKNLETKRKNDKRKSRKIFKNNKMQFNLELDDL